LDLARNGIRVAGQGVGPAGAQQRLGPKVIPGAFRGVFRRRQPGQVPGSRGLENINNSDLTGLARGEVARLLGGRKGGNPWHGLSHLF